MLRLRRAFTLVEVLIVVAILGILIAIAVPGFIRSRDKDHAGKCQENLKKIDNAKEKWALKGRLSTGTIVPSNWLEIPDICGPKGYLKKRPVCPSGGTYHPNNIDVDPTCSIGTSISQNYSSGFPSHVLSWE